ncbi:prephenate dehydrogenase/arogenate dehydrogenase family protein [Halopelagius longus]|uniref:Prephenate dehydrogenase n=1 Tax=Halopelagius longus TaxID=1236180 RepID=A0A1H1B5V7_9EURY|nr:prephenate dehydrogenase/arogenate dehydrogenase family protein [Halopelagius longus]RDI70657.1 prephenate dehydrogenase/arogenate dehydrogenase family protein [Halopelagius longus]SDQ47307.1 prephenate dehydrogenase [Halopelagius longus]
MEVLVVGAGAMGRWAGETLAAEFDVAYADRDPGAAEAAAESVGRAVSLDAEESFDAVCLAVPISTVREAVREHAPKAERAVVDVTGVMDAPVAAMRAAAPDRERVSLHPLFAPENAPGNVAVVADAPGPVSDAVLDAVADAGNEVFETTATEHDAAMETVQAGAHAAILAYALAAEDVREEFATPISAGMDELVEAVTTGTPRVYREIQESFPGADRVAEAARRLADADGEAFEELYEEAAGDGAFGSGGERR